MDEMERIMFFEEVAWCEVVARICLTVTRGFPRSSAFWLQPYRLTLGLIDQNKSWANLFFDVILMYLNCFAQAREGRIPVLTIYGRAYIFGTELLVSHLVFELFNNL